jgi:hypothetical protein
MRNIFDEAIGASPISTVDVDAVVATGRRRVSRRRYVLAAAGTGVAAVTGVVAALALTTSGPPAPGPPVIGFGTLAPPDGSAPVRSGETPQQAKQRLAAALVEGLTAALPGVAITDGPTGGPDVVVYQNPGATLGPYGMDVVITTADGEGEIFLESSRGGATANPGPGGGPTSGQTPMPIPVTWIASCANLPAPYEDCEQSVGPDGQTIVVVSTRIREGAQGEPTAGGPGAESVNGAAGEVAFHHVFVTWTNARVQLTVASDTKRGEPNVVPVPPLLTRQQLAAIAIDPDLTVTG